MSERRRLFLLLLLIAAPAGAQQLDPSAEMARQRAMMDTLRVQLGFLESRDAFQKDDRVDSLLRRWDEFAFDSTHTGPVRIIGARNAVARRRELFRRAWTRDSALYVGLDSALSGATIVLLEDLPRELREVVAMKGYAELSISDAWRNRHDRIASAALADRATALLPADVRAWMEHEVLPSEAQSDALYRQLLLMGSARADECIDGNAASCAAVLGLHGDEFAELYTPQQFAAYLLRLRGSQVPRDTLLARFPALRACGEGDRAACAVAAQGFNAAPRGAPPSLRVSFLDYVARRVPGSFERLTRSRSGTLGERIEAAAGVPIETLLAEWHKATLTTPPDPDRGGGRIRLSSMLWVALFALFATRSVRWRIG